MGVLVVQGGGRAPVAAGMAGVEGAVWPTTGDIDAETESLRITITTFNRDMYTAAYTEAWPQFEHAWNAFAADFAQWCDAGWFWNPSRRDQLLEYRRRFNDLRAQFLAMGAGASTGIAPVAHDTPEEDIVTKAARAAGSVVNKILIVAGVGVGLYVAFIVYRDIRAAKHVAKAAAPSGLKLLEGITS